MVQDWIFYREEFSRLRGRSNEHLFGFSSLWDCRTYLFNLFILFCSCEKGGLRKGSYRRGGASNKREPRHSEPPARYVLAGEAVHHSSKNPQNCLVQSRQLVWRRYYHGACAPIFAGNTLPPSACCMCLGWNRGHHNSKRARSVRDTVGALLERACWSLLNIGAMRAHNWLFYLNIPSWIIHQQDMINISFRIIRSSASPTLLSQCHDRPVWSTDGKGVCSNILVSNYLTSISNFKTDSFHPRPRRPAIVVVVIVHRWCIQGFCVKIWQI